MGDRLATMDMGRKAGGWCAPFCGWLRSHLTQCRLAAWSEAYFATKWHLDPLITSAQVFSGLPIGLTRSTWFMHFSPSHSCKNILMFFLFFNKTCFVFFLLKHVCSLCRILIMVALWNRADHYIFILWFLLLSIFFFSSPNLSGRRLDVYHTSSHGVALV